MKRLLSVFAFVLILCGIAQATTHIINFSYPSYNPSGLSVIVGDTIVWKGDFSKFPLASIAIPEKAQAFNNATGTSFSYVVTVTGTYKYQCETYKSEGMGGYFIAVAPESKNENTDNPVVYINYYSHAFHLVTSDAIPHNDYVITVATVTGKEVYKGELKATEKDKWVATETFPPDMYILTATDGTHSFGRKFTK